MALFVIGYIMFMCFMPSSKCFIILCSAGSQQFVFCSCTFFLYLLSKAPLFLLHLNYLKSYRCPNSPLITKPNTDKFLSFLLISLNCQNKPFWATKNCIKGFCSGFYWSLLFVKQGYCVLCLLVSINILFLCPDDYMIYIVYVNAYSYYKLTKR